MVNRAIQPERPKAVYFGYDELTAGDNPSGFFCLSRSSWLLVWRMLSTYGYWRTRYVATLDAQDLETVSDEEWQAIQDLVDLAQKELAYDMSCDLKSAIEAQTAVLTAMNSTLQGLQATLSRSGTNGICGCQDMTIDGQPTEAPTSFGEPGDQFPDEETYLNTKCQMANLIWETVDDGIEQMQLADVDTLLAGGTGLAFGLVAALVAAGPVGWAVGLTVTAVAGIVGLLLAGIAIDLEDLRTSWGNRRQDLVCAMYAAQSSEGAGHEIFVILGEEPLTPFETQFIYYLLTNTLLAQLFAPTDEALAQTPTDPIDCATCGSDAPCAFQFQVIEEDTLGSGSFRYDGIEFTLSSAPYAGFHLLNFNSPCVAEEECDGLNWCIELTGTTIGIGSGGWNRVFRNWETGCSFNEYAPPGGMLPFMTPLVCSYFELTWNEPFTLTMRILGQVGPASQAPDMETCE